MKRKGAPTENREGLVKKVKKIDNDEDISKKILSNVQRSQNDLFRCLLLDQHGICPIKPECGLTVQVVLCNYFITEKGQTFN